MFDARATLQRFYDRWAARDMDALLAFFDPAAVIRDQRHMASWGGTREDWRTLMETWWELIPDGRLVELDVLVASDRHVLHFTRYQGTDSITGGPAEVAFYLVSRHDSDGRLLALDFFDDESSARDHLGRIEEAAARAD